MARPLPLSTRTSFSPAEAAFEGVRVARREPGAVIYWVFVWALALAAIGVIKAVGGGPVAHGARRDTIGLIRSYGPLALILVPSLLALWVMNIASVYRAVLRPGEHGWRLFKLGDDEARIAIVSAAGALLIAVFGGVPAYLLFVIFTPVFEAAPGLNPQIAFAGALATIILDVFIVTRFSLVAVQTFAERKFHVSTYWPLTKGEALPLFLSYLIVVGEILLVALVLVLVVGWAPQALMAAAEGWKGPSIWRRVLLLALALFGAAQAAMFFVALTVLPGGCQAFAYRAISEARRAQEAA
jgi:hypothetical protein